MAVRFGVRVDDAELLRGHHADAHFARTFELHAIDRHVAATGAWIVGDDDAGGDVGACVAGGVDDQRQAGEVSGVALEHDVVDRRRPLDQLWRNTLLESLREGPGESARWDTHRQREEVAAAQEVADQSAIAPGDVFEQPHLVVALQLVQQRACLRVCVHGLGRAGRGDRVPRRGPGTSAGRASRAAQTLGGIQHRGFDLDVAAAAAQVAGEVVADFLSALDVGFSASSAWVVRMKPGVQNEH